jgi:hypothetical protein
MIRKSFFTLMFLAVMGYVSAQSLQFEWEGTVYSEGETIECTNDEYGFGEYIQHMQVRNKTTDPIKVLIEKEIVQDLEGVMNSFCWGMCYGPDTFVSPTAVEVAPGSVNTDDLSFHALYDETVFGDVIIKYYAYEERNPDDRISIIVRFRKSGEGVGENSRPMSLSKAYPNPATTTVNFNYSFDGSLCAVIYNLVGQEMMRQELNANDGQMSFSVVGLQEGIYFCTMMVNGRALNTQKFVVRK